MGLDTIKDVRHYTGGGKCHYDCGEPAEFVVEATTRESGGRKTVTFAGCRDCLNDAVIYPIDNGWVDKRTDKAGTA